MYLNIKLELPQIDFFVGHDGQHAHAQEKSVGSDLPLVDLPLRVPPHRRKFRRALAALDRDINVVST